MKKILFIALFLCFSFDYAHSEESLPLKIKASVHKNAYLLEDRVSTNKPAGAAMLDVQIVNISKVSQDIGHSFACQLGNYISDNPNIFVDNSPEIAFNDCRDWEEILKPGEIFKDKFNIFYRGTKTMSGPLTFRIGVKKLGTNLLGINYMLGWSDPITVNVVNGKIQ